MIVVIVYNQEAVLQTEPFSWNGPGETEKLIFASMQDSTWHGDMGFTLK